MINHRSSEWPVTRRRGLLAGVSRRSGSVVPTGSGSAPLRMSLNPRAIDCKASGEHLHFVVAYRTNALALRG